jgi:hypothetical protein
VHGVKELVIGRDVGSQLVRRRRVPDLETRWVETNEGISFCF